MKTSWSDGHQRWAALLPSHEVLTPGLCQPGLCPPPLLLFVSWCSPHPNSQPHISWREAVAVPTCPHVLHPPVILRGSQHASQPLHSSFLSGDPGSALPTPHACQRVLEHEHCSVLAVFPACVTTGLPTAFPPARPCTNILVSQGRSQPLLLAFLCVP